MDITLKPFEQSDIYLLTSWVDSEELLLSWAGTFFKYPLDQQQLAYYLKSSLESPPARLIFKAIDSSSKQTIGHIELDGFDLENQSAFICRVLVGPAKMRGRGLGKIIVKQLVDLAFNNLDLHRLAVGVLEFNQAAIHCYKQCGFQHEGCYREIVKYNGEFHSLVSMSLLKHEWQQS